MLLERLSRARFVVEVQMRFAHGSARACHVSQGNVLMAKLVAIHETLQRFNRETHGFVK